MGSGKRSISRYKDLGLFFFEIYAALVILDYDS